jgi:hypothetical protein
VNPGSHGGAASALIFRQLAHDALRRIFSFLTRRTQERTLNRKFISTAAAVVMAVTSSAAVAVAQAPAKAPSPTPVPTASSTSFSAKSAGPTVEANRLGVKQVESASKAPAAYDAHIGAGRNVALMVVGGAALIVGAVIGGAAGLLIAVAGAAVGLYGLYYFIQ